MINSEQQKERSEKARWHRRVIWTVPPVLIAVDDEELDAKTASDKTLRF